MILHEKADCNSRQERRQAAHSLVIGTIDQMLL
jgi:hypothetical protein